MGASLLAFGRMILVLGLIIGLLLALAHFARKRQLGSGLGVRGKKPTGQIEVLSRRSLGRHVSLLVVRVADQTLLVGQSSQQMTLLAELNGDEWVRTDSVAKNPSSLDDRLLAPRMALGAGEQSPWAWDACVNRLREMTVRR
jgi:flagellar biosynthetic protein FliO